MCAFDTYNCVCYHFGGGRLRCRNIIILMIVTDNIETNIIKGTVTIIVIKDLTKIMIAKITTIIAGTMVFKTKEQGHYESKLEMWFFAIMSIFFSVLCSLLWFGFLFENGVCIAIGVVVTIVVAATIIVVALVQKDKYEHNYQNKKYYKKNRNNRYY